MKNKLIITTFFFICIVVFAYFILGCATIVSGSKQNVNFISTPNNARIIIDGIEVGKTPLIWKLERDRSHTFEIELEGYKPFTGIFNKRLNGWFFGNILIGGLIGMVIDIATGAIYNLTPKDIDIIMRLNKTSKLNTKNNIYIGVTLEPNKNWEKIGQLEKES